MEIAKAAQATSSFESALVADIAYEMWFDGLRRMLVLFEPEQGAALQALLAPARAQTEAAVASVFLRFIDSRLVPCAANLDVFRVDELNFFHRNAAKYGIDTAALGLDRPSFLRKVNDCLRPVLDPATLPSPLTPGQPASLDLRAQVVFNGRPDPVGVPFEFTITPTDATVATPVVLSDAAGRFTTVFTPSTAAPTFNVRACLVLAGSDGNVGSDICVTQQVGIPSVAGRYQGTTTDLRSDRPPGSPTEQGMRVSQSGSQITIDLFRTINGVEVAPAKRFTGTISPEGSVRIGPPLDPVFYGSFADGGFIGFLDEDGASEVDLERLEMRRQ